MSTDPADLANLRDIVLPPAIPWWPPPAGWWVLAAGAVGAAAILAWRAAQRYRANAYRRAALRELADLARVIGTLDSAAVAGRISGLLKRTALVAYPRETVAALSGTTWLAFLDRSAEMTAFSGDAVRAAMNSVYAAASPVDVRQLRETVEAARSWVRSHRAAPANPGT